MNKFYIFLIGLAVSCSPKIREASQEELQEWDQWKEYRMDELKSPAGFLNLAGLYWLQEGENSFGSDTSGDISFPMELPDKIGILKLNGNQVYIADPIDGLKIGGQPAADAIVFDLDSGISKAMEYGTFKWFIIERAGDIGIRLKNLDHPNLKKDIDIHFFDYNTLFVVEADFITYNVPKKLKITNVLGHEFDMTISGQLKFEIAGESYTVEPINDDEVNDLFIIFSDGTSGKETYGSGRYLHAQKPDENGKVKINFNNAYNPPCAFTDFATCLIPPKENRLDTRIEAGEFAYHVGGEE